MVVMNLLQARSERHPKTAQRRAGR